MEALLITALLEKGGLFGIVAAFAFFWILYKDKQFMLKTNTLEDKLIKQAAQAKKLEIDNLENIKEINKVNEDRVNDLKQILAEHNKTFNDTSIALEKIQFFLENNK
jgi:GTP1/Obg family GTP-binding protein